MITTTLAEIRAHKPCTEGWRTLTTALRSDYGDTTPLPLLRIVDTNGIADALWALAHVGPDGKRIAVKFAADCAERVLPIWEARHPDDDRPRKAIEAARGGIVGDNDAADAAAAYDTAADATHGDDISYAAAAYSAAAAAAAKIGDNDAAATAAAKAAAFIAAYGATPANAYDATADAAYDTAYAAERAWQKCHLKELLDGVA
ncbi:MAG: putative immunity protein [Vulcanimicrobiaceae bacterium]